MRSIALKVDPLCGEAHGEVCVRGQQLVADPLLNTGPCFTHEERASLELLGLLP